MRGRKSTLLKIGHEVKGQIIAKYLDNQGLSYKELAKWVQAQFAVSLTVRQLQFCVDQFSRKYEGLIRLGMPVSVILANLDTIDALGIDTVKQQLMTKLAAKSEALFSYLEEEGHGSDQA